MPAHTFKSPDSATRLDTLIPRFVSSISRSQAQNLIDSGAVLVDGAARRKNERPKEGAVISVALPENQPDTAIPQNIPLEIVFEDDDLLVVNKPQGMVVHPAGGHPDGTLVNALLHYCGDSLSGINGVLRPGIVHRIDKDTAGLLVVAKNDIAHQHLAAQLEKHSLEREYHAVCVGRFKDSKGTIDLPIGRSPKDRKKYCVTQSNSRRAVTHYQVLEEYSPQGLPAYSHGVLRLETGRTHQIRVHMSHVGRPVAGDRVYRTGKMPKIEEQLAGQCLFAAKLGFVHPRSGKNITLEAPLPAFFVDFLSKI
ncbi:MAG: RluA family pseudouridine synthase [Oscillospiraceae bacterium]|nr:RluA family pseudouridine synthase [Oscillospiraceae bacterium]